MRCADAPLFNSVACMRGSWPLSRLQVQALESLPFVGIEWEALTARPYLQDEAGNRVTPAPAEAPPAA